MIKLGECSFKYVIWGMGQNGLELYSLLPRESICAVIDKNKGGLFIRDLDLPIFSFEEYLMKRKDFPPHIIVISTFKYQSMEKLLIDYSIKNYAVFKKSSVGLLAYASIMDGTYAHNMMLSKQKRYYLARNGFYQELLYTSMRQDGYSVEWVKDECSQTDMFQEDNINAIYYEHFRIGIRKLKNTLKSKTVFIIGCGPSLKAEDLETLHRNRCTSMSVNDIYHIFSKTNWRPNYYFASDRTQLVKYEEDSGIRQSLIVSKKIFSDNYVSIMKKFNEEDNTFFFRQIQNSEKISFSEDCSEGVYCANTVVFGALQFAVYMGAKTIYLLGCDNGIAPGKKLYFYEDKLLNDNIDGWEKVAKDAYADMEIGYHIAKREAEKLGVTIFNATRGGYLEVFERVDFDTLFI